MTETVQQSTNGGEPPATRLVAAMVATLAMTFWTTLPAEGQGLLRRLQARRAARLQSQQRPPSNPNLANPNLANPNTAPRTRLRQTPAPSTQSVATPANRQFTPPSPTANRPATADRSRLAAPNPPNPDRTFRSPLERRPTDDLIGRGDSILQRSQRPATGRDAPTAAPATMGIDVVQPPGGGIVVDGFQPQSAAAKSGIQPGDRIVAIEGYRITSIGDAANVIRRGRPGQIVNVMINRQGTNQSVRIPLVAARTNPPATGNDSTANNSLGENSPANGATLGIAARDIDGVRGAAVTSVDPTSPAAGSIRVGDRLVAINGRLVVDAAALQTELARQSGGPSVRPILVRLIRDDQVLQTRVDPNATVDPRPTAQSAGGDLAGSNPDGRPPSAAGALGSMLGGLFGGGNKTPSPPDAPLPEPRRDPPPPNTVVPLADDDLSLGDAEPLNLPPPRR